jgi:NAD(P)-dependent dehydrogenase (short-subunit alcohol dehydrogenase family)
MTKSAQRVTSTNYAHPRRPAVARIGNSFLALRPQGSLQIDALLDEARRRAAASDFGDGAFYEPLRVLLQALETEARLHPLGRAIMRGRLLSLLENRLYIEALCVKNPDIGRIPLQRPIVIAGLQRTGTTLLHRLLAADPRARALSGWEALRPAPLPGEGRSGTQRRRAAARLAELGLRALAPEFFAIHPVESSAPEEDILLLDLAFMSQSPEATLHVPSYARWLETQELLPAYRYLRCALQVLTWQRAGDYWVLKTPHHMEFLRELLLVFPDAIIVRTHRDPQATMGSFCSMVAHGRGIFSDEIDPREVGRHWLAKVRRMIDRANAVADGGHGAAFIDVSYYDLLRNPLGEVRRIYAHAGLTLRATAEEAMQKVLVRDVQNRYGRHVYRARDFGLSPALIEESFADYRARFAIPRERTDDGAQARPGEKSGLGHKSALTATVTAVLDVFADKPTLLPLGLDIRLDGKTALLTGANGGLGRAIAVDLARRGARLLLACRSGVPEVGEAIARQTGSEKIEMLRVDLTDFDAVTALADELIRRKETIDLVICNAGLMPRKARATRHGHEVMYAVHFFANYILLRRLLGAGVIPNEVFARNGRRGTAIPRIVFVASETHRSSSGLDFLHLGAVRDYGMRDGLKHYGDSKLAAVTFATELARRLTVASGPSVAVHSLCPGPVDSGIAREAPAALSPLIGAVMHAFFRSPAQAAAPVLYLAAAPDIAGDTGWYLHLLQRKLAAPLALDPENGSRLWTRAEEILLPWL